MTGPRLRRPRPPLNQHIDFFGYWSHDGEVSDRSRALPRGAATVVIDVGGRERVDFYSADGTTRMPAEPAFLTGPGTLSYVTRIDPGEAVLTIHFRPGGALPFFGIPLADLENSCVNLTDLWGADAALLRERLIATPAWPRRIEIIEDFLLARLRPTPLTLMPVLHVAEHQPSLRVSEAAELTGLSPKRLIATFRHEIGLTPKAYLRVRRLQSALRLLDAGTGDGADVAATLGYFDQPHFVREFRGFTSVTPTQYASRRSALPSHVGLPG
ncbi:helix-turn-helix domain-containing protein [Mycolicibacterium llatzerense]|uniref:AraC family transcriptional regulator n=1 Tax=Mycolicibacterium llatzerense TaxID=280871 RepID=A0A0D1J4U2_9MYCO|nr:helix-turn-helix domain-containing protein [Mycolicibacterium llatzerense]KIU16628.1 AraC family transcriptional regulator [Mycolicibacterium llatzerense]MCT7368145.1 AraC family transcriptional regulator [Mycolicibacterium llatzerense]